MNIKSFNHSPKIGLKGLALVALLCTASQWTQAAQPAPGPDTDTYDRGTPQYVFTSFDPPDSVLTFLIGINNDGLITGQYNDAAGIVHSFTLKDGKYKVIDVPGQVNTLVSAPNMQGQVALTIETPPFDYYPVLYSHGQYTDLPTAPGWANTAPSAINASGHISGVVWNGSFTIVKAYVSKAELMIFMTIPTPISLTRLAMRSITKARLSDSTTPPMV
jgi:hypothetical protein